MGERSGATRFWPIWAAVLPLALWTLIRVFGLEATGQGLEPTWPGPDEAPWGLITIDHVLADERLGVAEYGVEGSDR